VSSAKPPALRNPLVDILKTLPASLPRVDDYLTHWRESAPDAEAAVDGAIRLSYRELAEQAEQIADALRALGVSADDTVATLAPPSIDFYAEMLATWRVGAVWLGVNPKYTTPELEYVIADARPRVLLARRRIGDRDFSADLRRLTTMMTNHGGVVRVASPAADLPDGMTRLDLSDLDKRTYGKQSAGHQRSCNATAMRVYTSGTTGKPKAANLPHTALVRGSLVRSHVWRITPWRALNNLPINHVGSAGDIACTTLVAGGCQVFLPTFSPARTLEALHRERVSFWYQVPTMFQLCLDAPEARSMDWSHLQAAVWSGGRASTELVARLRATGARVAVDYSMTESVGAITLSPLTTHPAALVDRIGWQDPMRSVRIVDPQSDTPVRPGQSGEAQLCDPWMFNGYHHVGGERTSLTADGWFRTGDVAVVHDDGQWQLVGRTKEMFKSGGYNVYPREVELTIESYGEVSHVAVIPIPDALYGEVGVAFVVAASSDLDLDALRAYCRARLANYKIPKHFVLKDALPVLPIGKIDKQALLGTARSIARESDQ
jgi:acyl-CoA synthetase (AMP-forming)/AMP-acid ligase II